MSNATLKLPVDNQYFFIDFTQRKQKLIQNVS